MNRKLTIFAVTGADSGLGAAICEALQSSIYQTEENQFSIVKIGGLGGVESIPSFDLTVKEQVESCAVYVKQLSANIEKVFGQSYGAEFDVEHILINCAGVNYIEWFPSADWDQYERLMNLNLRAPLMLTQNLLNSDWLTEGSANWFDGSGTVLNIISNASHMAMTNSAFYNSTKGALHIATIALNRELIKTHGLTVFGISPNKLAGTGMSDYIEGRVPELRGWTEEEARKYQESSLPAGAETKPEQLAEFIAFLLSSPERHKQLAGTVLPYGG